MTERYSKNITPDSLTGMIFAMEGIRNVVVLLNGPMGCKFYHSTTSQFLTLRPPLYLPAEEGGEAVRVDEQFLNDWFFRQSRVPCTWLDGYDYVYGSAEKVREGLGYIKENITCDLIVIINSPGASLIGDHLTETVRQVLADRPYVVLESPGYSEEFCDGYETAVLELLRQTGPSLWEKDPPEKDQQTGPGSGSRETPAADSAPEVSIKRVNLLGLSIWHRYWEGDLEELKRLLALCGIEVNCCLCAGNSVDELQRLLEADLNLVLYPEYGMRTAQELFENYQIPYYLCPGPPVGFSATEQIFTDICTILGTDAKRVLEESERARALSWVKIDGIHQMSGLPDGVLFAVEGECSVVYAFTRFFTEYFGMIPDCLSIHGGEGTVCMEKLRELLKDFAAGEPEKKDMMDTDAELVFGNANTIAALKTREHVFCGIEISQPGMGYVDVLPKTQLGIRGAMFLVEQVLNGVMSRL